MEPKPARSRTTWYLAATAVVAYCLFQVLFGPRPQGDHFIAGTPALFDLAVEDPEGKSVAFEQYKGKPLFLHFWATWCPPCVKELPVIEKIAHDPKLEGISFLCVALDDDPDAVRKFLQTHHLTIPLVRSTAPLPTLYESQVVPYTFLITADGRTLKRQQGAHQWDTPDEIDTLVKLLQPKKPKTLDANPEAEPKTTAPATEK